MTPTDILRGDLRPIAELIRRGSRVLDLGCGDGTLMEHLRDECECSVRGVELDSDDISAALGRGLSVVQGDLDEGLAGFPDDSFDVVVLSQTLQVVRRPALVVREMLRVAERGIISFPNFAHWRHRAHLALLGRMPMSRSIPYAWHDTPNIHHTTLKDFRDFVRANGAEIETELPLVTSGREVRKALILPSLFADTAIEAIRRRV